jgi:hypothetical protein
MAQMHDQHAPELEFFRSTPPDLLARPPLASSMQHFESVLFLVGLKRYPHALTTCASAIESTIKAGLHLEVATRDTGRKLFAKAYAARPELEAIPDVITFLDARNRMVHYGFTRADEEIAAGLLLRTGVPLILACHQAFFKFDLLGALRTEFGVHLQFALTTQHRTGDRHACTPTLCLSALAHLVRWTMRESLMADWEYDASRDAQETTVQIEHCIRERQRMEREFGTAEAFDCPVCDNPDAFVCELDEELLCAGQIVLRQGQCVNCRFTIPPRGALLLEVLCEEQVGARRSEILDAFGFRD